MILTVLTALSRLLWIPWSRCTIPSSTPTPRQMDKDRWMRSFLVLEWGRMSSAALEPSPGSDWCWRGAVESHIVCPDRLSGLCIIGDNVGAAGRRSKTKVEGETVEVWQRSCGSKDGGGIFGWWLERRMLSLFLNWTYQRTRLLNVTLSPCLLLWKKSQIQGISCLLYAKYKSECCYNVYRWKMSRNTDCKGTCQKKP